MAVWLTDLVFGLGLKTKLWHNRLTHCNSSFSGLWNVIFRLPLGQRR